MTYRLISPAELDAELLGAWRTVQSRNEAFHSPYFCPEFTLAVAAVRTDVRVVVLEDAGRAVGFFPHQRSTCGRGRPVGGPLSDFHGVLSLPGADWSVPALMRAARLSTWSFDHLVGDQGQFTAYRRHARPSPQIDLSGGYDQYVRTRRADGSNYISKTEALARKLEREVGALRFAFHEAGDESLQLLVAWKREQYRRAEISDVFAVRWTTELLRHLSLVQTPDFAGVCSALWLGDRVVAVHFGMRSRSAMHYWFPAYDPSLAKFSLGIILLLRILSAAADLGVRTFDLGKGDSQYKQRLMTGALDVAEGIASIPSLFGTLVRLRQKAETVHPSTGLAKALNVPLRLMKRIERFQRFR